MQTILEPGMRRGNRKSASAARVLCPFIHKPFSNCYCASTSSLDAEATIRFCGGEYEACYIYRRNAGLSGGAK